MGHFKALAVALLLAACTPAPVPAPFVVAPVPKVYGCELQRQAKAEYDALPAGSALKTFVDDYGVERKQLRAALNLPEPVPCR